MVGMEIDEIGITDMGTVDHHLGDMMIDHLLDGVEVIGNVIMGMEIGVDHLLVDHLVLVGKGIGGMIGIQGGTMIIDEDLHLLVDLLQAVVDLQVHHLVVEQGIPIPLLLESEVCLHRGGKRGMIHHLPGVRDLLPILHLGNDERGAQVAHLRPVIQGIDLDLGHQRLLRPGRRGMILLHPERGIGMHLLRLERGGPLVIRLPSRHLHRQLGGRGIVLPHHLSQGRRRLDQVEGKR